MQRKFLYKMFTLQLFSIFCLSLHLILRYRGVQGAFHIASFGEEGEYLSHDSVSVNRKDFSKFNQNINYDKHNYMVPPTNPSSRVFSKPIAGEHTNLEAEDISLPYESDNPFNSPESVIQIGSHQVIQNGRSMLPQSDYMSYKDSINHPSNFQEIQTFHPETPWNTAPAEVIGFSGRNNQIKNYPYAGPFKYLASSSKTIAQPIIEEGLHDGVNFNIASYFDGFSLPDLSLVPHIHQNLDIPSTELTLGNPAFHSMPKDPLNSPQSSKVRDRELDGYNKQSREALNLNPRTTFQIFGPINANTKINQLNKLINKESSNLITSEKRKRKVTQLELKAIESFEERLDLIRVLKEDFTIGPKETSQKSKNYIFLRRKKKYPEEEAKYQKYIGKKVLNFLREQRPKENRHPEFSISVEVDSRFRRSEISAFDNRKRSEIIESAFRIQWNGFDAIEKSISDNAYNFRDHKDMKAQGATLLHIENISNLGITFMKIIAKKYPKGLVSDEFGDDQCLLAYNNLFWNFCFKNHKDLKEDVRVFFRSIRGNSSEKDIDQFVSAKLSVKHNKPEVIFSIIKTRITTKTDRNQILLFSWYFVFLRTMVYYPELIFQCSLDGNQLKTFIENGILYFIQKYNKI